MVMVIEIATCAQPMQHHWLEGNCPGRCARCRKSLKSYNALTGLRCRWCQLIVRPATTTHYAILITSDAHTRTVRVHVHSAAFVECNRSRRRQAPPSPPPFPPAASRLVDAAAGPPPRRTFGAELRAVYVVRPFVFVHARTTRRAPVRRVLCVHFGHTCVMSLTSDARLLTPVSAPSGVSSAHSSLASCALPSARSFIHSLVHVSGCSMPMRHSS